MARKKALDVGSKTESKEIKKKDLLEALDRVKPGLSARDAEFECYLFMGDSIATYGDNVCVVTPFPIGFSCSVRKDEFYKLVSGFAKDELSLERKKGELVARSGKASFGLAYSEPGPPHEMVGSLGHKGLEWKDFSEEIRDAVVLCSFSTSKDLSKPALTGVYVGEDEVMSSDNYRISWHRLGDVRMERPFLIPASGAVHFMGYDLDRYSLTESWMHLRGGGVFFSVRLLGEDFEVRKAKEFFPEEAGRSFGLPKDLAGVLDKAMVLLQDDFLLDKSVVLTFTKDKVSCRVDRKDVGWFFESVALEGGPEEETRVEVNPVFLKEVLRRSAEVVLVDENRMMFISGNFKHLIALG